MAGMIEAYPLLDHGYIKLKRTMGGDNAVLEGARICYQTESSGVEADKKLIRRLLTSKPEHGTPFEHAVFQFEVKCPIFVCRQWFRHRIGCSYNERSLRYTVASRDYYVPMAMVFESRNGPVEKAYRECIEKEFDLYKKLVGAAWPKEQARGVLGTAIYTEFMWTVNARALMHFIRQRIDKHAQWEIQQYAQVLLECLIGQMPITGNIFWETLRNEE